MWSDDDPILQLPHVEYEMAKAFKKKGKNTIDQYCRLSTEERRALNLYTNPEHFNDAEIAIKSLPIIDVNVTFGVEGESDIAVGDFLTIKIEITHLNLGDN